MYYIHIKTFKLLFDTDLTTRLINSLLEVLLHLPCLHSTTLIINEYINFLCESSTTLKAYMDIKSSLDPMIYIFFLHYNLIFLFNKKTVNSKTKINFQNLHRSIFLI